MRPIVSSIGSISYECAKYLSDVLTPLVGQSQHHVMNSKQFASEVRQLTLQPDEELRSYDVSALFTSVPVDKALNVVRDRLINDDKLHERTPLSPDDVINLLELCLNCTYFQFQGDFYHQVHGAAMGSPVSPIICNLYMEDFEETAIASSLHSPRWWKRYVDDTHTILKRQYSEEFTRHLNHVDPEIQWTTEGEEVNDSERSLPFLDVSSVVQEDGTIKTKVYRKATHTDQYLNFNSNHPQEHKRGVVKTLMHRADSIVSDDCEREAEKTYIKKVLTYNDYPSHFVQSVIEGSQRTNVRQSDNRVRTTKKSPPVVIPYIRGVSEEIRRTMKRYNVQVFFKPVNTIRQLLVRPKDPLGKDRIVGPVYHITCDDCEEHYVGETERSLRARFKEHRRPSSVTSEVSQHLHTDQPGHSVDIENVKILTVENRWFERGVKEAVFIRSVGPTLNKDKGRYKLPHVWENTIHRELGGAHDHRNSRDVTGSDI